MDVKFCGDQALIVDLNEVDARAVQGNVLDAVLMLNSAVLSAQLPGVVDTIPAAQTLLITFDPTQTSLNQLREALDNISLAPQENAQKRDQAIVEIPVTYDGPDLATIAQLTQLSVAEVKQAHGEMLWTAAFGGFAPGFYYLVPQSPLWDIPRLESPRTKIPAGSVAVAGEFSAVYPQASPGGWQLLGSTTLDMWDLTRPQPSLLKSGDSVRFVEVKR
ncbi:5-oxoprolinase subunit B family protein [Corynebacterium callunae]|uniref:Allophanate hydrolase subunit 1 n=1 Tax=Corynebacterium callunae DSM 20147 TaxID=1121353 RepID=M1UY82_9CORY|nr:allophanate hydrolase subunit 1 [Corynebacterium callunae]AGG66388.1 allophanate hydrolase subunit 1 [Corynebacterium callunae DSM 20147]